MDRLPDIRKAAAPASSPRTDARSESSERREGTRSTGGHANSKAADETRASSKNDTAKADARPRADRGDAKPKEHRFEVHETKAEEKPAAQPETGARPSGKTADDVAELVAQQPVLRAQSARLTPVAIAKPSTTEATVTSVPLALPLQLEAAQVVAPTSEAPDVRTLEVNVGARPVNQPAQQPATVQPAAKPEVEAPRETQEAKPAQDLERAADILRQVRVHFAPRNSEAHIHLQPAELGRVTIHVAVTDGHMRATVRAEKREALDAIQAHLPELRATLRDSGIVAQDFHFSLGLENQPRRDERSSGREGSDSGPSAIEPRDTEHAVLLRATASASGVDLYA